MKIYLDNCCYNRPYDDQSQIRISLETQAKLYIQNLVKDKQIELVTSYILEYENGKNKFGKRKQVIAEFMETNESYYVGVERDSDVAKIAEPIMQTGVKEKDAFHVACAILAKCDYFITTDDRLLKYQDGGLPLVTPEEFIRRMEVGR
ncbi:hypothetical protein C817_00387 [Dorea sp. 5-2]|nr:hypothetical protein C817_00387 [Dorea sp. 5-2]